MTLVMTLLLISTARSEDKPCRRTDTGEVLCTAAGFKTLTDGFLDLKGQVQKQAEQLVLLEQDKADFVKVATDCQKALEAVPSRRRLATGYGIGVVSAILVTVAPFLDSVDLRVGVGTTGLVGLGIGYFIAVPD